MKRLICLILACLILTACGSTQKADQSQQTEPTEQTEPEKYVASQPATPDEEPEDPEERLAYRRDLVVGEMRRLMGTLWTPEEDIVYYLKDPTKYTEDNEPITLKAGRIYQGLPYTHASGSAYGFFTYATAQDEHGVYTVSGITDQHLTGEHSNQINSRARLGCDCADTLCWAWGRVAASTSFTFTGEMTYQYGCIKVGEYICDLPKLNSSTKTITNNNGEQVMFTAYGQLLPGDGMVLYTKSSGGHAVMVVESHVEYADGVIDGENSYVVIIEQKSGPQRAEEHYYSEELGQNVYICGAMDSKWTFNEIFKKGYLPVTCQELIDPAPRAEQSVSDYNANPTIKTLWTGTLSASYRIASVTITITQDGKTVQQATAFGQQKDSKQFSMLNFLDPNEAEVLYGSLDIEGLQAGTYRCTVSCLLSTGNNFTVHDFEFTK